MGCGNSGGFNQISNAIRPGAHKVFCVKFQKEMEGLDEIPFEGNLVQPFHLFLELHTENLVRAGTNGVRNLVESAAVSATHNLQDTTVRSRYLAVVENVYLAARPTDPKRRPEAYGTKPTPSRTTPRLR